MKNIIELSDISKSYGDNNVLNNFSLKVQKGAFLAITGKSGAGKSTLLNIIGLLEKADSGTLSICDIKNPTLRSRQGRMLLRSEIGYLFQNYGLVDEESVLYNLRISSRFLNLSKKMKQT